MSNWKLTLVHQVWLPIQPRIIQRRSTTSQRRKFSPSELEQGHARGSAVVRSGVVELNSMQRRHPEEHWNLLSQLHSRSFCVQVWMAPKYSLHFQNSLYIHLDKEAAGPRPEIRVLSRKPMYPFIIEELLSKTKTKINLPMLSTDVSMARQRTPHKLGTISSLTVWFFLFACSNFQNMCTQSSENQHFVTSQRSVIPHLCLNRLWDDYQIWRWL